MIEREPIPLLRPYIQLLWASSHAEPERGTERERMIPSASMHLVFRFSDQPIRIFRSIEDMQGDSFLRGVVGGMRSSYYVKNVAWSGCTVGASLRPGACEALFGLPADEVAGRHVGLEDLWGSAARHLYERVQEAHGLDRRLQALELILAERVRADAMMHPAIAHALNRFADTANIGRIVEETGYSHRHFINLFRQTVGVSPRVYTRLRRFQMILKYGCDKPRGRWSDIALEAGYSDQAHFNREFREMTGISPSEYLLNRAVNSHHVRIRGQFHSRRNGGRTA